MIYLYKKNQKTSFEWSSILWQIISFTPTSLKFYQFTIYVIGKDWWTVKNSQVHQHVCLILANLSTTDSNNFPRCIYTSFYQIYDNYLPLFCYEKFPFISVFIFFYHTHSKRDKKNFGYIGSWLYRFRSDAEVVPFHWLPYHIPLEWPVWHCLIECNFHLYHGFLHVHFWTHLFSMKAIINDTLVHSSSF